MGLPNGVFKFLVTLLVVKSKEKIQLNVSSIITYYKSNYCQYKLNPFI